MAAVGLLSQTCLSQSPFVVQAEGPLSVEWRGLELVTQDEIATTGFAGLDKYTGYRADTIDGNIVHNIWVQAESPKGIPARREVVVEGEIVEIIAQYNVPAYSGNTGSRYILTIPASVLDGFEYKAVTRRNREQMQGRVDAGAGVSEVLARGCSYIAFEKDGRRIAFDCNPSGPSAFNNYGPTQLIGQWQVVQSEGNIQFYFGGGSRTVGGVYNGIIRIIDGASFDDFYKYHAVKEYTYYDYVPAWKKLDFGPGRLFGLLPEAGDTRIEALGTEDGHEMDSALSGSGKAQLPLTLPSRGLYVLTFRTMGPAGPFTISVNGKQTTLTKPVAQSQCQTVTLPVYAWQEDVTVSFDGNWKVNGVSVQPMIFASEDFTFRRRLWRVSDIPTPSPLYLGPRRDTDFAADVQVFPAVRYTAEQLKSLDVGKISFPPETVSRVDTTQPDMRWLWDARIGGLGTTNFSSFYEFNDPADLKRAFDDFEAQGFNVLLLNGLLYRHTWPGHLENAKAVIKQITDEAHRRGIKVIDHQSFSIIINADEGLAEMADNIDITCRDMRNGEVTRAWCANHPKRREEFFAYMKDLVKTTDIDGLMIDEVTFHRAHFCGCEYCREQFHRVTGMHLPVNEEVINAVGTRSPFWRLWLQYRSVVLGDFRVALREAIKEVKPNFFLITYTTHHGLTSPASSFDRSGGDIFAGGRSSAILGTEIMSRNVYESYRQVYAGRSLTNSLRWRYDVPIFGLVYPLQQMTFAYSGWAMNNMHGQSTWLFGGYDDEMVRDVARYMNWQDNMQSWRAQPVSNVAVVFSLPSRNHPRGSTQTSEMLGICQLLGDMHVQYAILLNDNLTSDDLMTFKCVIVPNSTSMSDADLETLRQYVMRGGHVLATRNAGSADEWGRARQTWPIGEWLTMRSIGDRTVKGASIDGNNLEMGALRVKVDSKRDVAKTLVIRNHEYPAFVSRKMGHGRVTYFAAYLGAENVQREIRNGQTWVWSPKPWARELLAEALSIASGGDFAFTSAADPRLRMKCWKYTDEPVWMVHLLNCTGASMKPGQVLGGTPPADPFPALVEDVKFDLALSDEVEGMKLDAYWVSPDEPGVRRPLNITRATTPHAVSVVVPKDYVKAYGIAVIEGQE